MFEGKPVIGVMPLLDEERDSYWMLPGYMRGLEEQGAIPLMPPLTGNEDMLDYFLESCDGFILTGGQDVSPALYGQEPSEHCGIVSGLRDSMDAYILRGAVERNKAVLGICRGHQLITVFFGGTLIQHMDTWKLHRLEKGDAVHEISVVPGSFLQTLYNRTGLSDNSCHHQAVKSTGRGLIPAAYAADGTVEAMVHESLPILSVQWHPERMAFALSRPDTVNGEEIFKYFSLLCANDAAV